MLRLQSICTLRRAAYSGAALFFFALVFAAAAESISAQSFAPRSTLAPIIRSSELDFDAEVASAIRNGKLVDAWRPLERDEPREPQKYADQSARPITPTPATPAPDDETNPPHTPAPQLALSHPMPALVDPNNADEPIPGAPGTLERSGPDWRPSNASSTPQRETGEPRLQWRPRGAATAPTTDAATAPERRAAPDAAAQEAARTIGNRSSAPSSSAADRIARRNAPTPRQSAQPKLTLPHFDGADNEPDAAEPSAPIEEDDELTVEDPVIATDDDSADKEASDRNSPMRPSARQQSQETEESRRESNSAPIRVAPRNLAPLTQQQINLRNKIRRVLKHYYDRPLNTGDRGPWELMHAMLSFEVHSRVLQGGPNGDPITAVGWLCFNQPCRGRTLFYLNNDGELRARVGPALQGHQGQLLALLALSRVKPDYPIRVESNELTIHDLVEMEKATCYPRTELTFKLVGLQNYLDADATWVNDQGMTWNFERLVAEELRQPVRGAACGGTHRLTGLTLSVKARKKAGLPIDGVFAQAERYIGQYQNYAYRLQNSDGSFSTEWFRGPGAESNVDRRLKTTGHTLEWLLYAGDEQRLNHHRTVRAVNYLANLMWSNRYRDWEAGPLGHAIHALVLYDRLVFAKYDEGDHPIAGRSVNRR